MDRKKKLKFIIMLVLLFIFGVMFYKYYVMGEKQNANDGSDNIVVSIQKIEPQNVTLSKEYVGIVTPINSVSVLPFISGFIDKVLVHGGQNVKIGDVLFIIRQAKYKAAVDSAYANVLEAKANLENAKTFYERMQQAGSKAVSKTEIDNARTSYLSAEAALTSAKSRFTNPVMAIKSDIDWTPNRSTLSTSWNAALSGVDLSIKSLNLSFGITTIVSTCFLNSSSPTKA